MFSLHRIMELLKWPRKLLNIKKIDLVMLPILWYAATIQAMSCTFSFPEKMCTGEEQIFRSLTPAEQKYVTPAVEVCYSGERGFGMRMGRGKVADLSVGM